MMYDLGEIVFMQVYKSLHFGRRQMKMCCDKVPQRLYDMAIAKTGVCQLSRSPAVRSTG